MVTYGFQWKSQLEISIAFLQRHSLSSLFSIDFLQLLKRYAHVGRIAALWMRSHECVDKLTLWWVEEWYNPEWDIEHTRNEMMALYTLLYKQYICAWLRAIIRMENLSTRLWSHRHGLRQTRALAFHPERMRVKRRRKERGRMFAGPGRVKTSLMKWQNIDQARDGSREAWK